LFGEGLRYLADGLDSSCEMFRTIRKLSSPTLENGYPTILACKRCLEICNRLFEIFDPFIHESLLRQSL